MFKVRHKSSVRIGALSVVALLLASALSVVGTQDSRAADEKQEEKKITHLYGNHECPVSGDKVDPAQFVEYKDEENHIYGRLYVCCEHCLKKTEENAAELYKKHYLTDPETGKAIEPKDLGLKECPVSGKAVAEDQSLQYNGMIVGFCCPNCPKPFLKDPDKYLSKILPDAKEYKFDSEEK